MPYDIPRPYGYRIQPFKLQDDEALVASLANQLLKARLAEARAAARGGGGGGGGGGGRSGGKGKGEWVMKYNPETKRYDKVWIEGKTKEEREINAKGEDFNKTADWLDANPEAQRLLGVLRNGKASNAAKQKALAEFRSLKGAEALEGMKPEAVEEVIERQAKPYKEQVEAEKKEIAGAGKGLLTNFQVGLERLGTFFETLGDDAETTLEKRRKSLERQQAIRESDPYTREQMRREAEGENLWDRSEGASGVAANVAGALLSDPSALPIAAGAVAGAAVGGPAGAAIGASLAAGGGAAAGDTYLGERLVQDDRLSEAERIQAYEEGKASEMGINAAVNAVPFGGAQAWRMGRIARTAAGKGALGAKAAAAAEDFAANPAWRSAEATADYARRFAFAPNAEEQVAKAAMRPIAADLVQQSERTVGGTIRHVALPEAAMASGFNAGAMLEGNIHYNALTGQNDPVSQGVPEAAAMGLMFGIPATVGGGIRAFRTKPGWTSPEGRLGADWHSRPSSEGGAPASPGGGTPPADGGAASGTKTGGTPPEGGSGGAAQTTSASAELPSTAAGFADLFPKNPTADEVRAVLDARNWTPSGIRKYMMGNFPEAVGSNAHGLGDIYAKMGDYIEQARPAPGTAKTSDVPLRTGREFVPTRAETPEGASPFQKFDETLSDSMGMQPYRDYSSREAGTPYRERQNAEFVPTRPAQAPEGAAPFAGPDGTLTDSMGMRPYTNYVKPEPGTPYREAPSTPPRQNAVFTPTRPATAPRGAAEFPSFDGVLTDNMNMREPREPWHPLTARDYTGARMAQSGIPPFRSTAETERPRQNMSPMDPEFRDPMSNRAGEATYMLAGGTPNGQRRLQGAGQNALVRHDGQGGTGGAPAQGDGTNSQVATPAKGSSGTPAYFDSAPPRAGDQAHPRGRDGRGTGGGANAPEDLTGGAGTPRTGRESTAQGDVGKRRAEATTLERAETGEGAGRDGHQEGAGAGSRSAGRGAEEALARWDKLAPKEREKALGTLETLRSGKDAGGVEHVASNLRRDAGLDRDGTHALLDRVQRGEERLSSTQTAGLMRLADYYKVPSIHERYFNALNDGGESLARRTYFILNQTAMDRSTAGSRNAELARRLAEQEPKTEGWYEAAADLLTAAKRDAYSNPESLAAEYFGNDFPEKWSSGEPITPADVHYAVDRRDAIRQHMEKRRNGDKC